MYLIKFVSIVFVPCVVLPGLAQETAHDAAEVVAPRVEGRKAGIETENPDVIAAGV